MARYSIIPKDLDAMLNREEVALSLTASGYQTSGSGLAMMATRGTGPAYVLQRTNFGWQAQYRWRDALDWAQVRRRGVIMPKSELRKAAAV